MEWRVRYIDYPAQFRKTEEEIMGTIRTVLSHGDLMLRRQLHDFEDNLASFVGARHAVGVSSGTDALHLSVIAAGLGPGDEVITVSHTFVATCAAIHHAGATAVLVDIADDHNMDVEAIEEAITPRTRAIMPVHLNGRTCDMSSLMPIAQRHGLIVLEDAAQALGSRFQGQKAGTFGLAGCFSFYPAKLLGAFGDGGAVVTNDDEIANKVRLLRNHGRLPDGDVSGWSFNKRLDNLHAAILDVKLRHLPDWIEQRREVARIYHEGLQDIPEVQLPPPPLEEGRHFDVFQNYEIEAQDRDSLHLYLVEQGVEAMVPWGGKGVHQFQALGLTHYRLPRTERMFPRALMIPMHPDLSDADAEYVTNTIRKFYGR